METRKFAVKTIMDRLASERKTLSHARAVNCITLTRETRSVQQYSYDSTVHACNIPSD